jgi:type IX secretion system PorP/SprF family membrane protein
MRTLLSFILITLALFAQAQDPRLNQFQFQKLELNPAYGGHSGNGMMLINIASRTSFFPVRGPFTYATAAIDFSPCKTGNLGLGILVNQESQGDGYYSRIRAGLNLAYTVPLNKSNSLAFGIRPGFVQQTINWDEFTFSDQLDPLYGISRPSFNHRVTLDLSSTNNWDAGIKYNRYKKGKPKLMIGMSGFNLFTPKIGLLSEHTLKRRISLHGSSIWTVNNPKYLFKSNFSMDFQGDNRSLGLNQEIIFHKKLGFVFGISSPFSKEIQRDINMFYISMGAYYQLNPSLLIYASYENNGTGRIIRGKTSSFEIGCIIRTARSVCQTNKIKDAFDFNSNKKIITPLSCPNLTSDGKIESF